MTEQTQTKRVRFLPYRFDEKGLVFERPAICLDAQELASVDYDDTQRIVPLDTADGWETLRVTGQVGVPNRVIDEVLPESERSDPPLELLIVARCDGTLLRRGVRHELPRGTNSVSFTLEFSRADLYGQLELVPFLRRRTGGAVEPAYASRAWCRVASSRPWYVRIDRKKGPPGEYLDVRWAPFGEEERFPADVLYHLDVGEHPILWLNRDFEDLYQVLTAPGTVGRSARLRDVFFDRIAGGVWPTIFLDALHNMDESGECPYGWQEAVLQRIVPSLRPGAEFLEAALDLRGALGEVPAQVIAELDRVLQADQVIRHMQRLVEEAQRSEA